MLTIVVFVNFIIGIILIQQHAMGLNRISYRYLLTQLRVIVWINIKLYYNYFTNFTSARKLNWYLNYFLGIMSLLMLSNSEYCCQTNNRTKITHSYQTLLLKITISVEIFLQIPHNYYSYHLIP